MPDTRATPPRPLVLLGGLLLFAVAIAGLRTVVTLAGGEWSPWLQDFANVGAVLQTAAFLFSAYQFWATRNERRAADEEAARQARKDSTYQAWQVINSAQGKGGSGGRGDALRDLAANGVSLAGVNLDGAWLDQVNLRDATLPMASFENANLHGAQFQRATLDGANFRGAVLVAGSLAGASLRGADFTGARLSAADLSGADLYDVKGLRECSLAYANIEGVKRAPSWFRDWAIEQGAVNRATEEREAPVDAGHSTLFRQI